MRQAHDFYPTAHALTKTLLQIVKPSGRVFECASGNLDMALVLEMNELKVITNDLDQQWDADYHLDMTKKTNWESVVTQTGICDWVITNPPFNSAMPILENAWNFCSVGAAMLLRLTFLEPTSGVGKEGNWRHYPRKGWLQAHRRNLSHLIIFGSPRPSFTDDGKTDSVTTAWMVWQKDHHAGTDVHFIPDWL